MANLRIVTPPPPPLGQGLGLAKIGPAGARRGPHNGIFGHKNGYTGRFFLRFKTFFRGFAGCPTVWEGSETVADWLWAPLTGEGVPPPLFENFPKFFWEICFKFFFSSKNTFYGFPGPKKVFLSKRIFFRLQCFFLGLSHFWACGPRETPRTGRRGPKTVFWP